MPSTQSNVAEPAETASAAPARRTYRTVDYHTAGQPFRIVIDGSPELVGADIAAKRQYAIDAADGHRAALCREPRGHADMYGAFVYAAEESGADFSAIFWHSEGYPPTCGHGTMALGVWAVESGLVEANPSGVSTVKIDVPGGRAVAYVRQDDTGVVGVHLERGTSYPVQRGVEVATSAGTISVDLAFSGALYASVAARDLGLSVDAEHYRSLVALGREIRERMNEGPLEAHPEDERLTGVFVVLIHDDLGDTTDGVLERVVNVFNDGWVDRSPCGSGTGARVALLAADGHLREGRELIHESIVGTRFSAFATPVKSEHAHSVVAHVEGMAYRTGENTFIVDAIDPLRHGFLLR